MQQVINEKENLETSNQSLKDQLELKEKDQLSTAKKEEIINEQEKLNSLISQLETEKLQLQKRNDALVS